MAAGSLKEYLRELMDQKANTTIRFRDVDGEVNTIQCHIVRMDEVSGRDIIETDAGLIIGGDQILDVDGRAYEDIP